MVENAGIDHSVRRVMDPFCALLLRDCAIGRHGHDSVRRSGTVRPSERAADPAAGSPVLLFWMGYRRGGRLARRVGQDRRDSRSNPVRQLFWYVETGFRAEDRLIEGGRGVRETRWNLDGTVQSQDPWVDPVDGQRKHKRSPPWLWGVEDQTHPSAPWWKDEGR